MHILQKNYTTVNIRDIFISFPKGFIDPFPASKKKNNDYYYFEFELQNDIIVMVEHFKGRFSAQYFVVSDLNSKERTLSIKTRYMPCHELIVILEALNEASVEMPRLKESNSTPLFKDSYF